MASRTGHAASSCHPGGGLDQDGAGAQPREGDADAVVTAAEADVLGEGAGRFAVDALVDRRDEAVSDAADGADHPLAGAVVADGPASGLDPAGQGGHADAAGAPDAVQHLGLAQDPVAVSHQQQEDGEDLRFDVDDVTVPAQLVAVRVQLTVREREHPSTVATGRRPAYPWRRASHGGAPPGGGDDGVRRAQGSLVVPEFIICTPDRLALRVGGGHGRGGEHGHGGLPCRWGGRRLPTPAGWSDQPAARTPRLHGDHVEIVRRSRVGGFLAPAGRAPCRRQRVVTAPGRTRRSGSRSGRAARGRRSGVRARSCRHPRRSPRGGRSPTRS